MSAYPIEMGLWALDATRAADEIYPASAAVDYIERQKAMARGHGAVDSQVAAAFKDARNNCEGLDYAIVEIIREEI